MLFRPEILESFLILLHSYSTLILSVRKLFAVPLKHTQNLTSFYHFHSHHHLLLGNCNSLLTDFPAFTLFSVVYYTAVRIILWKHKSDVKRFCSMFRKFHELRLESILVCYFTKSPLFGRHLYYRLWLCQFLWVEAELSGIVHGLPVFFSLTLHPKTGRLDTCIPAEIAKRGCELVGIPKSCFKWKTEPPFLNRGLYFTAASNLL